MLNLELAEKFARDDRLEQAAHICYEVGHRTNFSMVALAYVVTTLLRPFCHGSQHRRHLAL